MSLKIIKSKQVNRLSERNLDENGEYCFYELVIVTRDLWGSVDREKAIDEINSLKGRNNLL